jgi:putative hydrolase of the HAD superfamily
VIRAVFFDWGNTLVAWEFDSGLFVEGHVRGLAALGETAPSQPSFTAAYTERILPRLLDHEEDEVDYAAEIAALLATLGADADGDDVMRFLAAEQRVWRPTHRLERTMIGLLDALRERGLKVGLVSNLFDPPALMRELFGEIGLLDRLDAIALSAEVGKRKPHRAIFESALEQAGVAPGEAVMVGDRLREDVGGAQAIGMAAIQALWFARDDSGAAKPDATAAAPHDVLRWIGTT